MGKRAKRGYFRKSGFKRKQDVRSPLKRILIVCEGEATEPNYFKGLARFLKGKVILQIEGLGENTKSVVKSSIEIKRDGEFDEAWVVFDKDKFSEDNFNSAVLMARSNGLNVAYSIPCFELWLLLHFKFIDRSVDKDEAYCMLREEFQSNFGIDYQKASADLWDLLYDRIDIAVRNAERINSCWENQKYAKHNPSTLVVDLIRKIYLPYAAKLQNH